MVPSMVHGVPWTVHLWPSSAFFLLGANDQGGKMPKTYKNKTEHIVAILKQTPDMPRKEIAAKAGCTVARVGEVVRAGGASYTAAQDTANRKARQKRTERCVHEKQTSKPLGSCTKGCAPAKAGA